MTASTLTYPLDLIRTKLSIAVDNPSATEKPSIAGVGRQIYRTNGFLGLYKGLFSTLFVRKILACLTYCYRASYHTLGLRWRHLTYSRHISWLIKTIHISSWWILAWVEQLAQYQWPWHIPLILFEDGCSFQGSMDILNTTTCSIVLLG